MRRYEYPEEIWQEFYSAQRKAIPMIAAGLAAILVGGIWRPSIHHLSHSWLPLTTMVIFFGLAVVFCVKYNRALRAVAKHAREARQKTR